MSDTWPPRWLEGPDPVLGPGWGAETRPVEPEAIPTTLAEVRRVISTWPLPKRELWGRRSNELWDEGIPLPDREIRAFDEIREADARAARWESLARQLWGPATFDPDPGILIDGPVSGRPRGEADPLEEYAVLERDAIRAEPPGDPDEVADLVARASARSPAPCELIVGPSRPAVGL